MSTWTIMNIKGQGHSLNFVQGHSDSTFSILFCSETARPIETKFHMEPPWDVWNENLFKCSRSHDHAHLNYGEKYFSSEPRDRWLWNLVFSIGYSSTNNISYDDLGLILIIFMTESNCFRMLLHRWKLIQHWVLMSFQVCSNSTYPQHSGERYRISCPLVLVLSCWGSNKNDRNNYYVPPVHSESTQNTLDGQVVGAICVWTRLNNLKKRDPWDRENTKSSQKTGSVWVCS